MREYRNDMIGILFDYYTQMNTLICIWFIYVHTCVLLLTFEIMLVWFFDPQTKSLCVRVVMFAGIRVQSYRENNQYNGPKAALLAVTLVTL